MGLSHLPSPDGSLSHPDEGHLLSQGPSLILSAHISLANAWPHLRGSLGKVGPS